MFFVLEHSKDGGHFNQLGIVAASSIEEAATKIGMGIEVTVRPPESAVTYARLVGGYHLTDIPEITSGADISTV